MNVEEFKIKIQKNLFWALGFNKKNLWILITIALKVVNFVNY
jgi:hypothetical protein